MAEQNYVHNQCDVLPSTAITDRLWWFLCFRIYSKGSVFIAFITHSLHTAVEGNQGTHRVRQVCLVQVRYSTIIWASKLHVLNTRSVKLPFVIMFFCVVGAKSVPSLKRSSAKWRPFYLGLNVLIVRCTNLACLGSGWNNIESNGMSFRLNL